MLSLTYQFDPIRRVVTDKTEILPGNQARQKDSATSESTMALDLLKAYATLKDIDQELRSEPKLYRRMLSESENLLKAARFDTAEYRDWAEKKESQRRI